MSLDFAHRKFLFMRRSSVETSPNSKFAHFKKLFVRTIFYFKILMYSQLVVSLEAGTGCSLDLQNF